MILEPFLLYGRRVVHVCERFTKIYESLFGRDKQGIDQKIGVYFSVES